MMQQKSASDALVYRLTIVLIVLYFLRKQMQLSLHILVKKFCLLISREQ